MKALILGKALNDLERAKENSPSDAVPEASPMTARGALPKKGETPKAEIYEAE